MLTSARAGQQRQVPSRPNQAMRMENIEDDTSETVTLDPQAMKIDLTWQMKSSSTFTPRFRAYTGSRACSASIKAAVPDEDRR